MVAGMNRIMLAALGCFALSAPASAAERRYSVVDFDRVVVEGPYAVRLTTGRPSTAVATGSQAGLERVTVEVQGRTLRIRPNRTAWGGYPGTVTGPVTIELSTRDLRSALVSGPGSLAIDRASGLRIELGVEGSGRIVAGNLRADNLVLGVVGSGGIQAAGTAEQLRASVHGTGDLDASALRSDGANITTDTAGTVRAAVKDNATVTASGIGEVEIIGRPACTVRGLSAGRVRCSNQR
jgi:hypothetical protein